MQLKELHNLTQDTQDIDEIFKGHHVGDPSYKVLDLKSSHPTTKICVASSKQPL